MLVASPWPGNTWVSSGNMTEMAQAVDDAEHAAAREIGSADGALEEGIAREGYVLCLAIEGDGAAAVARSRDDL